MLFQVLQQQLLDGPFRRTILQLALMVQLLQCLLFACDNSADVLNRNLATTDGLQLLAVASKVDVTFD